ncbi:MAG: Na+/H+ antiporter subunit E [Gammaproteobacteria bacterium]|nr:Na+/H+ antiporter subunit E [Gammaproteobacteria bacterium]
MTSRFLLFSFIWWILTDGAVNSWWIGIPAVILATLTSVALIPPVKLVWYEVVRFVPYFIFRSVTGGFDVAKRAFHPAIPIAPDLVEYPLRLSPGLPQVFLINTISLLPGTLTAELNQNILKVHVLDAQANFKAEIEAVEQRVARMFSVNLTNRGGGE